MYNFVKVTGAIPALLWLRPKVVRINKNVPKRFKKGVLIAPNHVSFVDPLLAHTVFWYRRVYALATKDLFDTPLKNKFFTAVKCIKVDKDNFHMSSFRVVCDCLKEEKAVLVFPEGRVNTEEKAPVGYKSGIVVMAHLNKKPIVPVYFVHGKHWYNRRIAIIGEPINVGELCGAVPSMIEIEKASEYIRQKEMELMEYYHKRFDKKKKTNKE